ncbi:MAG: RHS repeat-associated core domain-containing protein [Pseudomonadota bacterium]
MRNVTWTVLGQYIFAALASFFLTPLNLAYAQSTQGPDPVRNVNAVDQNGVDLGSGSLFLRAPSLSIGPPDTGLSFELIYAGSHSVSAVTAGWRPNYVGTVLWDGNEHVHVSFMGASERFKESGSFPNSATYQSTDGRGSTLTWNYSANLWTYTLRDGTVAEFDHSLFGPGVYPYSQNNLGMLVSIKRPNGLITKIHYKSRNGGSPPSIYNPKKHRLQSITNNAGYQIHIKYRLNGPGANSDNNLWRTISTVTAINNAEEYCDPDAETCSLSGDWPKLTLNADGYEIHRIYDAENRRVDYGYTGSSPSDQRLSSIFYDGSSTPDISYGYNSSNRVQTASRGYGSWSYAYSTGGGQLTTTITSPASNTTVAKSDTYSGKLEYFKNGAGKTTQYTYDSSNRLTDILFDEGNKIEYTLDARGNVKETRVKAKPGPSIADIVTSATFPSSCFNPKTCNKPTSMTDARGHVTNYTYSWTGHVLTITQPDPDNSGPLVRPKTTFTYTTARARYKNSASTYVNGAPVTVLSQTSACATLSSCAGGVDETKTIFSYQPHSSPGNMLLTSVEAKAGNGAVSSLETYTHTSLGDVETVDGPLSGTADKTKFYYNESRQQTGIVGPDPDGSGPMKRRAVQTLYNGRALPSEVKRGTAANQGATLSITPLEKAVVSYDDYGRVEKQSVHDGASSTVLQLVQTSYDSSGRPECVAVRMNPSTYSTPPASACALATEGADGKDRVTKTVYDAASRPQKIARAHGTSIAQDSVRYTYTDNGLVATLTDARNYRTTYEYDGFDRAKKLRYPDPTNTNSSSTSDFEEWTYDAAGNILTERRRDNTTFTNTYDDLNRLTLRNAPGAQPDVTHAYDSFGRLTSLSQSGHTVSYAYDQLGRLTGETQPIGAVTHRYDAAGRRTRTTYPGSFYVANDYLTTGELHRQKENASTSGIGILTTYAYDDLGRRTSITRGNGATTRYGFDGASRLTCLSHDLSGGGSPSACGASSPTASNDDEYFSFAFNPSGQIKTRDTANDNAPYDHQLVGAGAESYTANGLNQIGAAGGASFAYDGRGNTTNDGVNAYVYDADNRLISANSGAATLSYDPAGRLYQVSETGGPTTRFLYDGADIIAEYDGSNNLQRRYVHGPGIDDPVVWYEGSTTGDRRWLHADERGSIIAVTNASAASLGTNTYAPFGAPGGDALGRFLYTGQIWLDGLELYHYKARAYNPAVGRFLQTDPIRYGDGMNMYAYVGNDPVNNMDSNGLWTLKIGGNIGYAKYFAGGLSGGFFVGSREDGSIGFGWYSTASVGGGVGVDLSVGGAICPLCSVEDLRGNSLTISGKRVGGIEISVPYKDNGGPLIEDDLQPKKTSLGFTFGLSSEATVTIDATEIGYLELRRRSGNNARSYSITVTDILTFDSDLYLRGYYDNILFSMFGRMNLNLPTDITRPGPTYDYYYTDVDTPNK